MNQTLLHADSISRREFHSRMLGLAAWGTVPNVASAQSAIPLTSQADAAWQRAVAATRADADSLRMLPCAGTAPAFVPVIR